MQVAADFSCIGHISVVYFSVLLSSLLSLIFASKEAAFMFELVSWVRCGA